MKSNKNNLAKINESHNNWKILKASIPPISTKDWVIERKGYNKSENGYFESLFVLSNGYMGIRNTIDFYNLNSKPGIFISGVYDNAPIVFTELVSVPTWLRWHISILNKHSAHSSFKLINNDEESYQLLDMKKGTLYSYFRMEDERGNKIGIELFHLAHAIEKKLYISIMRIKPIELRYSDSKLSLSLFLENSGSNDGLYPWVRIHHLKTSDRGPLDKTSMGIYLETITRISHIRLSQCAITIPIDRYSERYEYNRGYSENAAWEEFTLDFKKQHEFSFCRLVITEQEKSEKLKGSRDVEKLNKRLHSIMNFGIQNLIDSHISKWEKKWENAWVYLEGDPKSLEAIRFNIFQLLQAYDEKSENTSIPAKGLTGEGYRGHIFWDTEIFMFPFYLFTNPEAAKKLLKYRIERLPAAMENARKDGYKGARYPWESAASGLEVTPFEVFDFVECKKHFVYTGKEEIHITADIVYAISQYIDFTDDHDFLSKQAIQVLIETARFWESVSEWDSTKNNFTIKGVIGPDEFHEHVNNSFFTNFMAAWNLKKTIELLKKIHYPLNPKSSKYSPHLLNSSTASFGESDYNHVAQQVTDKDLRRWEYIANNIYLPMNKEGIMEEFEGYFSLKDIVINKWDSNSMPVVPDEVSNSLSDTQLIKQGDVVLLFHLHPDFFDPETIKKNFLYYEPRTTHSSSLSPMVYAIVGLKTGLMHSALQHFLRTSRVDLDNNQSNIELGLHLASCGGTWQVFINGFAGLSFSKGKSGKELNLNPHLPDSWKLLEFRINWKGNRIKFTIAHETIKIELEKTKGKIHSNTKARTPFHYENIPITVNGMRIQLNKKEPVKIFNNTFIKSVDN